MALNNKLTKWLTSNNNQVYKDIGVTPPASGASDKVKHDATAAVLGNLGSLCTLQNTGFSMNYNGNAFTSGVMSIADLQSSQSFCNSLASDYSQKNGSQPALTKQYKDESKDISQLIKDMYSNLASGISENNQGQIVGVGEIIPPPLIGGG